MRAGSAPYWSCVASYAVCRKTFTAVLEADGSRLRSVVARIPFDIAKAWPMRRGRRVRGESGKEKQNGRTCFFAPRSFPIRAARGTSCW